jgi:uncharacterized protein YndB with AHSA1/START domain
MDRDVVTVERVIPAPPEAIFDLIADASRHPDIDGSGTVKQAKDSPERLTAGSTFGMSMHMGFGYSMVNTVIEFEENRRIAWQAVPAGFVGKFVGGRIWRYELEPVDGGTRVRESWDVSKDRQRIFLKLGGLPAKTKGNMEQTLARVEELTAQSA